MYDAVTTTRIKGPVTTCRHCGEYRWVKCQARQLCSVCWRDRTIRDTYALPESRAKFTLQGIVTSAEREPEPTDAVPGSDDKVLILSQRAERGESLWHPHDRSMRQVKYLALAEDAR